jgi:hypothetical protein
MMIAFEPDHQRSTGRRRDAEGMFVILRTSDKDVLGRESHASRPKGLRRLHFKPRTAC